MSERIYVGIDDAELDAVIARLDEAIAKKTALLTGDEFLGGEGAKRAAEAVKGEVDAIVDESHEKLTKVEQEAIIIQNLIDTLVAETQAELAETAVLQRSLMTKFKDIDLPGVDRATRMILLRVPGIREVLRLMYVVKMEQRTLGLTGVRGPLTAMITLAMYAFMLIEALSRRVETAEARQRAIEKDMSVRLITLEEALRGYGEIPERYRSDINIG